MQKVAAPRRPHGAAPWVPPLSTALPRSSPTWLCLWARLGHFACFYPQAESAAGSRAAEPLALALCRANKSWHPVDHYWQPCMRWDEAREESGPFIVYLFHSHRWGGGGGDSLLAYWTAPLLSPVLARWSKSMKLTQLFSFPHNEFFSPSSIWLCSFSAVIIPLVSQPPVPPHHISKVSTVQIMSQPQQIVSLFLSFFFSPFDSLILSVLKCMNAELPLSPAGMH